MSTEINKITHGLKPEIFVHSRILNLNSDFKTKLLCDGPTFTPGSSCFFTCSYCYVESMMNRGASAVWEAVKGSGKKFQELIIRRSEARKRLREELDSLSAEIKQSSQVVYTSPTVDVAATEAMVIETAGLCEEILSATCWNIRLLSKSPNITKIASSLRNEWKGRMVFGLSTGTMDDVVAKAIEPDAPAPSLRLQALRQLQKDGFRNFAMLCPILPQNAVAYARRATELVDFERCEHVWAEVLNRRGKSMERTAHALEEARLNEWAHQLRQVFGTGSTPAWEAYARSTFAALSAVLPESKLRFLQYVTGESLHYWIAQRSFGAIPLGQAAEKLRNQIPTAVDPNRSAAAKKAWITIRRKRAEAAAGTSKDQVLGSVTAASTS